MFSIFFMYVGDIILFNKVTGFRLLKRKKKFQ